MTFEIDETHDPSRTSWVPTADGHPDFPLQNLPLGIFAPPSSSGPSAPRPGVAIGEAIVDLRALTGTGLLAAELAPALSAPTLNELFALPGAERRALRRRLSELLGDARFQPEVALHLHPAAACTLHLPASIGDYSDFYVGIHHATNVGRQFRPEQPLMPNYKYLPVGYHGRASSVRPAGEAVRRPLGQRKPPKEDQPVFGPSRRLDYELEMAVWIGPGNALGEGIPLGQAADHVAGLGLLNDWSARDVQAWEYQPLGPFLAKSFHTTVSPWVVTLEALAPFRQPQAPRPDGDPRPLAHLWDDGDQARGAMSIDLSVSLRTAHMRREHLPAAVVSRSAARHMYWTIAQMVTHHASNGCNLRPGDLLGTGTISAPEASGFGSLLESTKGGAEPLQLPGGETRGFLEDGDEVTLAATARAPGFVSIGFGPCSAVVAPARIA